MTLNFRYSRYFQTRRRLMPVFLPIHFPFLGDHVHGETNVSIHVPGGPRSHVNATPVVERKSLVIKASTAILVTR